MGRSPLQARKIVDVLSEGLPVRHAYIGVQVVTITPGLARQHNTEPGSRGVLPEIGGLLVANVSRDRLPLSGNFVVFSVRRGPKGLLTSYAAQSDYPPFRSLSLELLLAGIWCVDKLRRKGIAAKDGQEAR